MSIFSNEKELDAQYKKVIAKYINGRCKEDEALAKACEKPNKSLDGLLKYVKSEAKKLEQDGCAVVPDEDVFNWAVHYILEDSLDCEPEAEPVKATVQKKPFVRPDFKETEQKTIKDEIQLELF